MTKEEKFYKVLQDVFIGAKIEGEGGFINLMRIKANYYSQIEKVLKEDINNGVEKYPSFREELFDKLYSFFNRYFTNSGSIYFNSTPFHNNIYEKVYTDEKDVILFWKTQMLYYVKTDRIFRSMPVESDSLRFYFDAGRIENKKANEKRSLIYEIKEVRDDKTIVFTVLHSGNGSKTKSGEILKQLKKARIFVTEELLEKAFRVFEKQSEVDFFINKNAKAFLEEQFKLWSYQYFWEGGRQWSAERVNELQILKDIAFKIIDFISQFEDELVKIWNKPKFARKSNYVITLDRIKDKSLVEKIIKHKGINGQIKEWRELGIVDESFSPSELILSEPVTHKKYEHLPIDTKYFKDIEFEILALFDDLDNQLDGWLIKSENYQALNTILPKFKEKVQTIYIDPPFNLDSSDQFLYRTNYKNANWATLLENRLKLAKDVLNEKGSIFLRCDYNGNWIARCLMDDIFIKENFRNEIIVKRTRTLKGENKKFATSQDTLFLYAKNLDYFDFNGFRTLKLENEWKWVDMHLPGSRKDEDLLWRNFFGKKIKAPEGRRWTLSQDSLENAISQGLVKMDDKSEMPKFLTKYETLGTDWLDISGYSQTWDFTTENSEILLNRVIRSVSKNNDIVCDFFLGSGATTAVAHKLGRKWIGVEMGDHFYSVVLPRMKKVLSYDKSGVSKDGDVNKRYNERNAGGFFKYYELEQYEEALANCKYDDGDLFTSPSKTPYQEYVFMKDEKMLKTLEIDYENNKVIVDMNKLYPDIDIAETLSNLTGKWIKTIKDSEVEFTDRTVINTKELDYKLIKPLIWWE